MCRVGRIVLVYLHQADRVADLEARAVARELHADIDMAEILRGRCCCRSASGSGDIIQRQHRLLICRRRSRRDVEVEILHTDKIICLCTARMNRECIVLAADDLLACRILRHAAVDCAVNHSLVEINRIAVCRCRHVRRIRCSIGTVDIARNSDAVTERYLVVAQGRDLRRRRCPRRCRWSCRRRIAAVDRAIERTSENLDGIVCCRRAVSARYIPLQRRCSGCCPRLSRAKDDMILLCRPRRRASADDIRCMCCITYRPARDLQNVLGCSTGAIRSTAVNTWGRIRSDSIVELAARDEHLIP